MLADPASAPAGQATAALGVGFTSSQGLPAFLLLFDVPTLAGVDREYDRVLSELGEELGRALGFSPTLRWAALPPVGQRMGRPSQAPDAWGMAEQTLDDLARSGVTRAYVLPASFDFDLQHKQGLVELTRTLQRRYPDLQICYGESATCHPLLVQALVDNACRELERIELRSPHELGVLLVANGAGGPDTRADSYRMLRLVWEQVGASRGDVAFVRHARLPLPEQLEACARTGLTWLLLPAFMWPAEPLEYARVIANDVLGERGISGWPMAAPLAGHPNLRAWLGQRLLELYRSHRQKFEARLPSARHNPGHEARLYTPAGAVELVAWDPEARDSSYGDAVLAELSAPEDLRRLLASFNLAERRLIVKPTWHGYATGTYSDAAALGVLLGALGEPAVLVEGHTSSRNSEPAPFDWESEARAQRAWIREHEQQYLEKTGLIQVLRQHRASYLNVTECWWDEQCAPRDQVERLLESKRVRLAFPELAEYVPQALFDQAGAPLLSFARFKGPTRLSISNLFGLLPEPLRAAWHGPNITYFAKVCCDLAKLYGAIFELYALVESLSFAVRWEPRGLYRSRWGNYDLIESPRVVCLSRGLPAADVLAARLQGQDVERSAFFDVVRAELGFDPELSRVRLPEALLAKFV